MADQENSKAKGLGALLGYAGEKRWLVVLGCVLSGISGVLAFGPYLAIWAIVRALLGVPTELFGADLVSAAWFAAACAAGAVLAYMAGLGCTHRAAFHIAAEIRTACGTHLLAVPLGFFQTVNPGELQRKLDAGVNLTEDVIAHKLPDLVGAVVSPLTFAVLGFVFDWRMGLACLVPFVVGFSLLGGSMGKGVAVAMDDYQAALDAMNAQAMEYVRGIPVVKVFQQTAYSFRRFYGTVVRYGNLAFGFAQVGKKPQIMFWIAASCAFVLLVPVAWFAIVGASAADAPLLVADFIFYAAICTSVPVMLTRIMYVGQSVMSARTALHNIDAILGVDPLPAPDEPRTMRDASIVFDHVTFSYPGTDRPAVEDVSFEAAPGQTVALVGASGSGKSTCAALIPRFWDVEAGSVQVGGFDVRDLDPRDVMENVAFVFQGGHLLAGTLLDNVVAARPDASRAEALAALSAAQCDDILEKMPHGVDTRVDDGAVHLSGGERQRILLARALLKDAPIVVLDEATAFADAENEARIQEVLATLMADRTVVMVAHRLSTVVDADEILVLDQGSVVERGTHAELLAADGAYRRMWEDYRRSISWRIGEEADHGEVD